MMNFSFIKGYEKIMNYFNTFPSFHDDYIKSIEIKDKKIIITIKMNKNLVATGEEVFIITFSEVKEFELEGELWDCGVSIINEICYKQNDEYIETIIYTSLGTAGEIKSKYISIEMV